MPCTICRQPGHNKLKCGHAFHATCIYDWIKMDPIKNNKCPYCQKSILSPRPQKIKKTHPLAPILILIKYVLEKLERLFG